MVAHYLSVHCGVSSRRERKEGSEVKVYWCQAKRPWVYRTVLSEPLQLLADIQPWDNRWEHLHDWLSLHRCRISDDYDIRFQRVLHMQYYDNLTTLAEVLQYAHRTKQLPQSWGGTDVNVNCLTTFDWITKKLWLN